MFKFTKTDECLCGKTKPVSYEYCEACTYKLGKIKGSIEGFDDGRRLGRDEGYQHAAKHFANLQKSPWDDQEIIKKLILLCHPDKHGGSQVSTEITSWLLSMRK